MDDTTRRVADADPTARSAGAAGDPDTDRRVTEIRNDIEHTREEMSETIDAIQEKLRPRNIVAEATERVKTATTERVRDMAERAGDTASNMMDQTRDTAGGLAGAIRDNPIPAALIGVGTAWLLMNRSSSPRPASGGNGWRRGRGSDEGEAAYESADATLSRTNRRYGGFYYGEERPGLLERVRNNPVPAVLAGVGLGWLALTGDERKAGRARGYWREGEYGSGGGYGAASAGAERWTEGSSIGDSATDIASRAKDMAGDATQAVRQRSRRAQNQLQRMLEDSPLLVGAGALMLGAAFGLALPETEAENEWMGETRDSMIEGAQDMARDAASRVTNAATGLADVVTNTGGKQ